jgi:3-hydroxypropionyl-CoA synthetase (ADP-forming)
MDLLDDTGLTMPDISPDTVARLVSVYPGYYVVQNPVDVTGSATSHDYQVGIEALLDDPNIDLIMPWFVFQDTPLDEAIVDVLGELSDRRIKPILVGAMGGPYTDRMAGAIEARGVPVFDGVRSWMAAARALSYHSMEERK